MNGKKFKIFCRTTLLKCLQFYYIALSSSLPPNLFKRRALGDKMAPPERVLGSNHRNRWNIFKNLLQNHLPQMLEIMYVALSSGPLPSLFKSKSEGPTWPYARGSWV